MMLIGANGKKGALPEATKDYVNPVDNLLIGKMIYPLPAGWSGSREGSIDKSGFFECIYSGNSVEPGSDAHARAYAQGEVSSAGRITANFFKVTSVAIPHGRNDTI